MKTLQNNFTTPEQSKRLLALGVPVDSADCYYLREHPNRLCILNDGATISGLRLRLHMAHTMPCWSVGRLIEIMALCYKFDLPSSGSICIYATDVKKGSVVDTLISDIERYISQFDFSKLDDYGTRN